MRRWQRNKVKLRSGKVRQGIELADGRWNTIHDLRCLEISGCDMEALSMIREGSPIEEVREMRRKKMEAKEEAA